MTASEKLSELGIVLPALPAAAGSYLPWSRTGNLVYTAGQLPMVNGTLPATGKVGEAHGLIAASDAKAYARQCALNAIAAAAAAVVGGLLPERA